MKTQNDFSSGPYVSIWIGAHKSEEELDDYLNSGRFSKDYQFSIDDNDLPEISVEPVDINLDKLIEGFSCYERFQEEAVASGIQKGISTASSIMVFHFLAYSPDGLHVSENPEMTFLGNFWFEGFK